MTTAAPTLTIGELYRCPSGMGGTFDVRLMSLDGEKADVRVDCPRNPDWHRYAFSIGVDCLRTIPTVYEVRTRVKGDDYLTWGRYPIPAEADKAAESARKYPSSLPVVVVPVSG